MRMKTFTALAAGIALASFLAISTAGQGTNPEGEITPMGLNYDGAIKVIATDHMPGPAPAAFGGDIKMAAFGVESDKTFARGGGCDKQLARFGGSEFPMRAKYEGNDPLDLDLKAMSIQANKDAFNHGIARAAPGDYDIATTGFYREPQVWYAVFDGWTPRGPTLQQAFNSAAGETTAGTVAMKDLDIIDSNQHPLRA